VLAKCLSQMTCWLGQRLQRLRHIQIWSKARSRGVCCCPVGAITEQWPFLSMCKCIVHTPALHLARDATANPSPPMRQ
jgi:hypothetical protein